MENDKPGIGGETFVIKLDKDYLILGEDIIVIADPRMERDGWVYEIEAISDKAKKLLNAISNSKGSNITQQGTEESGEIPWNTLPFSETE